jgi:TPR repeat protein
MSDTLPSKSALVSQAQDAIATHDYDLARSLLIEARRGGEISGLTLLGWMYATGTGVEKDQAIAETYYREGANAGDSESMLYLGRHCIANQDSKEGEKYLQLAAEHHEPAASLALGRLHYLSVDERLKWLEYGVLVGNVYCLSMSGRLLLRTPQFARKLKGLIRIFQGFVGPVIYGVRKTSVDALYADKRFQK